MPYDRTIPATNSDLTSLINTFKSAQAKANEANEKRYQQLMEMYGGEEASLSGLVQQFGQQAKQRVATQTQQMSQQARSNLVASGLGIPSVMDSVQRGFASDAEKQNTYINEAMLKQQAAGTMGKINAITSRTDAQPDMGMFAQLLAAASNNAGSVVFAPTYSSGSSRLQNAVNSFRSSLGMTPLTY